MKHEVACHLGAQRDKKMRRLPPSRKVEREEGKEEERGRGRRREKEREREKNGTEKEERGRELEEVTSVPCMHEASTPPSCLTHTYIKGSSCAFLRVG